MFKIPIIYIVAGGDKLKNDIYNNVKHAIPDSLKKEFAYSGSGLLRLPLFLESDEYSYVMSMSTKYNLHATPRERTVYTKQEEENCPFFLLLLSTPLENNGLSLECFGTSFETECYECSTCKRLLGNALIERNLIKNKDIVWLSNSIISVSERFRKLIEKNNFTGINFKHKVQDYKNRTINNYYCIEPDFNNILPPMHNETWLIPWETKNLCGHSQFYLFSNVKYSHFALEKAKDFNYSTETDVGIDGNRFMIVSKRVRDMIRKYKIRAWCIPIDVI